MKATLKAVVNNKNTMRRAFVLICLILFCGCICIPGTASRAESTESNPVIVADFVLYRIEKRDGQFYMCFKGSEEWNFDGVLQVQRFASVAEMKSAILSGKLTYDEIRYLWYYRDDGLGDRAIFNLEKLYDFCIPKGQKICYVTAQGSNYACHFTANGKDIGYMRHITSVDRDCQQDIKNLRGYPEGSKIISLEIDADRNAQVTHIETQYERKKYVDYEIHTDDKSIIIREEYTLEMFTESSKDKDGSDTNPTKITFLGIHNGNMFTGIIQDGGYLEANPFARPSADWLSSFGLTELEDNSKSDDKNIWFIITAVGVGILLLSWVGSLVISIHRKKKMSQQTNVGATTDNFNPLEDT